MKHGALFNGIGGFQLAASWMGWENVMSCEIDNFCNRVTKYHFPNCIQHGDIDKTDFSIHRGNIDIITGGFPCQPYSTAGKRKGNEDDRHLWPEMLRGIREVQPSWVVGENVRGLTNWNGGLVFDEVQANLEDEGYEVLPFLLPACAVNAPHRRDRIWFIAHSTGGNDQGNERKIYSEDGRPVGQVLPAFGSANAGDGENRPATHAGGISEEQREQKIGRIWNGLDGSGERTYTNAERSGLPEWYDKQNRREPQSIIERQNCVRGWHNFPTQPPVCSGNDGLPDKLDGITFSKFRNESLKGYGNAIVPQVAYQIFKAIEQYESLTPQWC